LSDVLPWVDGSSPEPLQTNFTSSNALLAVLRSTPAALATLCNRYSTELERRPAQGEWSAGEVLCHLRDVDADVNLVRLRKVINERNPFLPGQETDPWADERQYCLQDGLQALADFTQVRLEVLRLLDDLPPGRLGTAGEARHFWVPLICVNCKYYYRARYFTCSTGL
jgi:hypothetical protein